jgi:hypothetical protein
VEVLNVDDAEYEDKLVEDEVPKFVFHVLDTRRWERKIQTKKHPMRVTADVKQPHLL